MGIWIRTQDRQELVEISGINIFNQYIQGKNINGINKGLGEYKTEERALEILDEIQKRLTGGAKRNN